MLKKIFIAVGAALGTFAAIQVARKQRLALATADGSIVSPELKDVIIPTASAAGAIALFTRMSHGNTLRFTFVPTMVASWVLYMRYLRKRNLDGARIAPLYLAALAWQFVHLVEEFSTGFNYRWPREIFHTRPYRDKPYIAINLISYFVFLLGGIALLRNRREFYIPAVFFSVMGVMFNGVQHPVYSLMVRGYFPGLWTGLVDLALGPVLLKKLLFGTESTPALPSSSIAA